MEVWLQGWSFKPGIQILYGLSLAFPLLSLIFASAEDNDTQFSTLEGGKAHRRSLGSSSSPLVSSKQAGKPRRLSTMSSTHFKEAQQGVRNWRIGQSSLACCTKIWRTFWRAWSRTKCRCWIPMYGGNFGWSIMKRRTRTSCASF